MKKMRTWQEIEQLFSDNLIANFPNQKFTTESNMYKIMAPIMEEVQRIEQEMVSYVDRNNYLKAEGVDLDLYFSNRNFLRRQSSKSSGIWTTINSVAGTSALKGEVKFEDEKGNTFVNIEPFTVASNGKAEIKIESEEYGVETNSPKKTVNTIKTPVVGLISGTNLLDLKGGEDKETDYEYRFRWEETRNSNSFWNADGIISEINKVNGVKSCKVLENDTDSNVTVGGSIMPSRSRRYYVDGGSSLDIAEAIYRKTDRAIEETGTETATVHDTQGDERVVKFSRPTPVKTYFKIIIDGTISTNEANKIITKYIEDSRINEMLSSFNVVETIRHSIDVGSVINLEIHFSRDNSNFFSKLQMDEFEKAVN